MLVTNTGYKSRWLPCQPITSNVSYPLIDSRKLSTENCRWGPVQTPLHSCAEPNWIRSDFGATLAWQLIQTAYRVSILTFISCLGPIPYFSAIIYFLFVKDRSSCFCGPLFLPDSFEPLHLTFSCSSITFRKHCSQYASEVPAFQPLTVSSFSKTEQGIRNYSWHRKQV